MGNSASSSKTSTPNAAKEEKIPEQSPQTKEVKKSPCCGGHDHRESHKVAVESQKASPAEIPAPIVQETASLPEETSQVLANEPVVIEKVEEIISEENDKEEVIEAIVVETTSNETEDQGVEELTEAIKKIEIIEEASEFSIAGKSLKLDNEKDVEAIVEEIKNLKNLQKVSFVGNTIGVEASKAIASALDAHEDIRDADFSDCFTGRMKEEVPVSVAEFGKVLVSKKNLTRVNFSDNAFGPIGAKALVELLSGSASLQELILNNNGLGPEGGKIIAEALIESAEARKASGIPLRKVLIGRNRLENGSSEAFAKLLEVHNQIQEFGLPQCGIRSEGVIELSKGLGKCKDLACVDLQDNTFTTSGAKSFSEAIQSWTALKSLNIGDCMCEAEGSKLVIEAISNSNSVSTLEFFNFQYNEMDEEGALLLAENLSKFANLKSLMLNGNAFNPEGSAANLIKDKLSSKLDENADLLDSWSDMEYDDEDGSELGEEDRSGFITESERANLVVEAETDN